MRKLILVLTLIMSFSFAFAQDYQEDFQKSTPLTEQVNFYQPLYMQNNITDNLWINQPLKETISWSHGAFCLAGMGFIIAETIQSEPSLLDSDFIPPQDALALFFGIPGASIGLLSGVYKSYLYNKQLKLGNTLKIKRPSILTEYKQNLNMDRNKIFLAFSLRIKKKIFIFDEVLLNTITSDWLNIDGGLESKILLGLSDVYKYDKYFSPYYNLLGGYSVGRYHTESDEVIKKNFTSLLQAGLKVNILDFAYFKIETEYEYSPFYYHLKNIGISESNMLDIDNFNLSLVLGASIF